MHVFGWLGSMVSVGLGRLCMGCGWDRVDLFCAVAVILLPFAF